MEIEQELSNLSIHKLDKITVCISNENCLFYYTVADKVCKDEFKGKYRYFGGLQCNYEEGSPEYNEMERFLCMVSEKEIGIAHEK